ncbi:enolase-like domain-containing protein [Natronococcus occultus]|uniref:Enolase superfamily enzyme related to L-alanine-DL-glutamate epimerase n=1 Tax=Natronococcus occultus SP4 TaxID=694430 RepID=L0JXR8_9EURY|nr:hypothetical protein [Natronococcus occultus]AGB37807.1 enolase superfamily enzyme related to L-alanine-DL-glutamate epimerase [Natronococcus occultus SP4]
MRYDQLADLSLTIEDVSMDRLERETSSGFTRVTTEFVLEGPDGAVGRGEDVTYETEEHDALAEAGPPDLAGEYTIDDVSARLADLDLFPAGAPDREVFRNYRRWGLEAAALDLALRQAGTDLATRFDREYEPVRFIASTRLGDEPSTDRVDALREAVADVELKLDPTPEWDAALVEALAATDAVRVLDLKGQYHGTEVDVEADPELYELVIEAFPEAVLEDPALEDDTEALFENEDVRSRTSWDAPIHGLEDVRNLPWEPEWLNIKPSRFGSLESLLETIDYCLERGMTLYGGGQFELGVGRGQLQAVASLFYPDTPNDVAPGAYNDPEVTGELPESPLEPPADPKGFRWS